MSGDIHALSGAYAVDAVDDLERAMFERHLAQCGTCRAEVDSLREAAAVIAETSAQAPPTALRERVLAGIETVRPLPPVVASSTERVRSSRRRFPALVAAAAALIAVGGVGATVWHPWESDTPSLSAVGRVQEAPDARTYTHELPDGGSVTVVRSKSLDQAVISTDGLERLDDAHTYELWLIHDGVMVKAGLMDGDASSVLLDGDAAGASGAGITVEPAGGSDEPTLDQTVAVVDFDEA